MRTRKPANRSVGAITSIVTAEVTPAYVDANSIREITVPFRFGELVHEFSTDYFQSGDLFSWKDFQVIYRILENATLKVAHFPSSIAEFMSMRASIPYTSVMNARAFLRFQFALISDVLTPINIPYTIYLRGSPNRSVTDYFTISGTADSMIKVDVQAIDTITNLQLYSQAVIELDLENWYTVADIISADLTFVKLLS